MLQANIRLVIAAWALAVSVVLGLVIGWQSLLVLWVIVVFVGALFWRVAEGFTWP